MLLLLAVVRPLSLLLEGWILTVRMVLGESSKVVECSRLGGEVWIVTAIELSVRDWFCIINQAHFTGSWSITIGDIFLNLFITFHAVHWSFGLH